MQYHILSSTFDEGAATLEIVGRTPSEARGHTQTFMAALKKCDPTAIFKTPSYEGFRSEPGRHVYRLYVVYGSVPARTEAFIHSLV